MICFGSLGHLNQLWPVSCPSSLKDIFIAKKSFQSAVGLLLIPFSKMDSWAIPTLSVTEHEQLFKCFVAYILHNPQISYYHSHHTHNNRILFGIMDVIKRSTFHGITQFQIFIMIMAPQCSETVIIFNGLCSARTVWCYTLFSQSL